MMTNEFGKAITTTTGAVLLRLSRIVSYTMNGNVCGNGGSLQTQMLTAGDVWRTATIFRARSGELKIFCTKHTFHFRPEKGGGYAIKRGAEWIALSKPSTKLLDSHIKQLEKLEQWQHH
jgi:hypothetical protein